MLSNKFYTYETEFWCARPKSQSDLSVSKWLNLSSPLNNHNDESQFDHCSQFDVDFKNVSIRPKENTSTVLCNSWEYSTKPFDVSMYSAS